MRKRVAMFKVRAASVEEYFRFDPAREDAPIAAGLESGQLVAR
jgi:hypothetical protein